MEGGAGLNLGVVGWGLVAEDRGEPWGWGWGGGGL